MPRIFDNLAEHLLPALQRTLVDASRADFCVGYFNLRGWSQIAPMIEGWNPAMGERARVLIGMQELPKDELRNLLRLRADDQIDQQTALRLKRRMAEEFRVQLTFGAPNNQAEADLRRLSTQLKSQQVIVKLHLRHLLHAKLYLCYRRDYNNPITGFIGSSNLTLSGLSKQGELNVDILEHDACQKLARWFDERWEDRWCLDISDELIEIIDTSWAREALIPPYHIYLKMAYHLSQEARAGLAEYSIPRDFDSTPLFDFQVAAVKIAAHHLNKRGGVLIGDVVGLGKTLMATALARIFQDDYGMDTLILCPPNLAKMWQQYVDRYRLLAKVLPVSRAIRELPNLRRYKLVLIDESHNLRNREGKSYKAIQAYIEQNDSKCILLSATPYNKTFLDLSAQLRLFVPETKDLGVRPERLLSTMSEATFRTKHQSLPTSLAAFEKSEYIDDWRELMRLYMVRRTRSFIQRNYAKTDLLTNRQYLDLANGGRTFFPKRTPRTLTFAIHDEDPDDPYARLYATDVVDAVNSLRLPRYGLGNYVLTKPPKANDGEKAILKDLGRAGQRLMGVCRTNLFKRLESGGPAFLQSIERHVLRNYVYLHALDRGLPLPLGTQDATLLDTQVSDMDNDELLLPDEDSTETMQVEPAQLETLHSEAEYQRRAAEVYTAYTMLTQGRFKWLRPSFFDLELARDLRADAHVLLTVRERCGRWEPSRDTKLLALVKLLRTTHPDEKILIFSQFADTVNYLVPQLRAKGITALEAVTGEAKDPTELARRFSPQSNPGSIPVPTSAELRVLVATDVLSEGQNLQDAAIIVNYDLPWAIIRLIQRAGRVDRIGQRSPHILCYSFLPADGVERIIRLRSRVEHRLQQNAEVVGTDEAFFEGEDDTRAIVDLYNEKAGIFDGEADTEIDLASYAYQIWQNAVQVDPSLKNKIPALPDVVYSARQYIAAPAEPQGALLYLRSADGNDSMAWVDMGGQKVNQSHLAILRAAECGPNMPAMERHPSHHALVEAGVHQIAEAAQSGSGGLGRTGGARFRTYTRLEAYVTKYRDSFFEGTPDHQTLLKTINAIYHNPLRQSATDTLNRQLKSGIDDDTLVQLVITLYNEDRLCIIQEEAQDAEPRLICSLGLYTP